MAYFDKNIKKIQGWISKMLKSNMQEKKKNIQKIIIKDIKKNLTILKSINNVNMYIN